MKDLTECKTIDRETLNEIIRRIVEVAKPDRIVLFGSAVRGAMGPHSDLDLLVIKSGEYDHGRLVGDIYMNLHGMGQDGMGQAIDIILVTPEQVTDTGTLTASSSHPLCGTEKKSTMPARYPPEDPREWVNRARSDLEIAMSREKKNSGKKRSPKTARGKQQ